MNSDRRTPLHVETLSLRNRRRRTVMFRVEPWGRVYEMPAGASFQVKCRGPAGDTLEVQWSETRVTVFAWPGSTVTVLHRGVEIGETTLTAPWLPLGMRTREWLAELACCAA